MEKKFKFPSSVVILFSIIVLATLLTWVVPAGNFDMIVNEDGVEMVDGESFHFIEDTPVGIFDMFKAIPQGFVNGAEIFFLILFGYFWVYSVLETGAFAAMTRKLMSSKLKDSKFFIPIVMIVFALAGSTYGEFETVYGLIPIFVALSIALGYDAIVGVCITFVAVAVGFAAATTNPFTIGIAQSYAELPLFSGIAVRWGFFVVFVGITIIYVMRYAAKIKADPSKSLVAGEDYSTFKMNLEDENVQEFTGRHKILMLGMVVSVGIIVYGTLNLYWWLSEMMAVFIISGIVSSIIGKRGPEQIAKNFTVSCSEMIAGALIIGLSRTILVVLENGNIIDSLIYYMYLPMENMASWMTAEMMLIAQNLLNFVIPSGSGQAAAIMPIMIPLADLAEVNRQVAVLAYQFGDGFSNLLWPTGACAIMCGIAKVPLGKWYKFFLPLFGIIFVIQSIGVIGAALLDYGPF